MTAERQLIERVRNVVAMTEQSPDYKGAIEVIRAAFADAGIDIHKPYGLEAPAPVVPCETTTVTAGPIPGLTSVDPTCKDLGCTAHNLRNDDAPPAAPTGKLEAGQVRNLDETHAAAYSEGFADGELKIKEGLRALLRQGPQELLDPAPPQKWLVAKWIAEWQWKHMPSDRYPSQQAYLEAIVADAYALGHSAPPLASADLREGRSRREVAK